MRTLSRYGSALAVTALLLGGCAAGGSPPTGGHGGRGATPSAHISHSPAPERRAAPAPARPWNVHPSSVAALGDSITRGFNACRPLADCPEVSWATGSRTAVDSIGLRLAPPAARSWNLARSGARVADLPDQARAAAAHRPAMVTVLIGANDACAANVGAMTPVADFRTDFDRTLSYLHRVLPGTQVLVASIPDLRRLWSVGRADPLGKEVWKLGLCPTMLDDPDSFSTAAGTRRTAVRERVIAYNSALGQVCAKYARCRYDGGAVFGYRFTTKELSTWDWFHPNERGEAELARLLAAVAFGPSGR